MHRILLILLSLSSVLLVSLTGCASLPEQPDVLAIVEGEPVTRADIEYLLEIAHRREDLSSARPLSLSDYLQKVIDEKLIIQEARRMGLQDDRDIRQKVDAYILREAVVRLYNEEIEGRISLGGEEVLDVYRRDHEQFVVGMIEVGSEEEAAAVMEKLQRGEDFAGTARAHSQHVSANDGGTVTYLRKSLGPFWEEALVAMKTGELSDIRKSGDKYYIVKFIERREAPESGFEKVKNEISASLRKKKLKQRSDEYLKYLYDQSPPKVDRDLFSSIKFEGGKDEWLRDERPLVEIDGIVLTAGAFAAALPSDEDRAKENALKQWTDKALVDKEALARHYELRPDMKEGVRRYQDQIIKNAFISSALARQVAVTDKEVTEYYQTHGDEFIRPVQYRLQQITVKTSQDAEDIVNSLKGGAAFSWLARSRSMDAYSQSGGNAGWRTAEHLPPPLREIVDTLVPGDISPPIEVNAAYTIFMLIEKSEKTPEDLEKVRAIIQKKLFSEKFDTLIRGYIEQLKKDAEITVFEGPFRSFEQQFRGRSHGKE